MERASPAVPVSSAQPSKAESPPSNWALYRRAIYLAVGLVAFLIVLANFVSAALNILLLLFLCVLLALGLRGIVDWLAAHTPLSEKVALALVTLGLIALIVGFGVLVGPRLVEQFNELGTALPEAVRRLEEQLSQTSWGKSLVEQLPSVSEMGRQFFSISGSDVFSRITGVVSSAFSFLSSVVVVLFITFYLALQPRIYVRNFLRLVPIERRKRVWETLDEVKKTLQKWLLVRFISAIEVGVLTFIGLMLLGVPLALPLSIIAAVGAFIPTFGPLLAVAPAALVALIQGPEMSLVVVILYTSVQAFDNYVVTPILEKSLLYLPLAYTLTAQLFFGVIAGPFGLVLAAPIAAALVIVVRMMYVEDVLGDHKKSFTM